MGRKRKTESKILHTARARYAGMHSADAAMDLGGGKDLVTFQAKITAAEEALLAYNEKMAELDIMYNQFIAVEKELGAYSAEMLAGVKAIYGRDSDEYEAAGGVRFSERKKPKPKNTDAPEMG